jgi:YHS domain-containing protein
MLAVLLIFTFNSLVFAENAVKALDKDSFGVAIKGYDSVAYFTEGKAVKGNEKYSFSWNEAVWYFSNAEHRGLFAANPKKYVPHRGGW